jgi:hypothetical protein
MDLKEYIEMGEEKAGSQVALAKFLSMNTATIRKSKNGAQGIPIPICIKLANYINVPEIQVIAASELTTEKKPERRQILEKCLTSLTGIAFAILLSFHSTPSEANLTLHKQNYAQVFEEIYIMSKFKE